MSTQIATKDKELRLDDLPDLLTISEVAKLLRTGKGLIYEMVKRHELDAIHLGPKRMIRIPRQAVLKLVR